MFCQYKNCIFLKFSLFWLILIVLLLYKRNAKRGQNEKN
nr:MAG TPA: hypothetical protein [Caudoviricetes sp.]